MPPSLPHQPQQNVRRQTSLPWPPTTRASTGVAPNRQISGLPSLAPTSCPPSLAVHASLTRTAPPPWPSIARPLPPLARCTGLHGSSAACIRAPGGLPQQWRSPLRHRQGSTPLLAHHQEKPDAAVPLLFSFADLVASLPPAIWDLSPVKFDGSPCSSFLPLRCGGVERPSPATPVPPRHVGGAREEKK
ncbi:uncharacterized protein LOC119309751 [Triticum dicoccoides]|uniref:uncharacterized protein LOC119309751 n=1 Tax=Triticum dicoccoides TaxID=85692 RepID=UPI001891C87F|nr:uncharacterized protein LOC119309751 [Triticum dicoccoides]